MKSLLLLLFTTAFFAVSCASGPEFSTYTPSARPASGLGRIWFYRPSVVGAAVQPAVKLDGKIVGHAVPRGFFHEDVRPGAHEVSVATEWNHKTTVNVTAGGNTYVRLSMMVGVIVGHVIPKEVPASRAADEMKNLHFAGTSSR